jgi:hypothetical protein
MISISAWRTDLKLRGDTSVDDEFTWTGPHNRRSLGVPMLSNFNSRGVPGTLGSLKTSEEMAGTNPPDDNVDSTFNISKHGS